MTAPLGSAFGGYLQAAVYKSLDGAHGHAGWRWLYIVCGCMTIPVGVATLFVLPDTPYTTKSKFLTAKECELAIDRVTKADRNVIPTGSKLISAFCIILWGFLSDYTGSRFALIICPLVLALIPNGILAFWPQIVQLKLFAFLTSSVHLMTAVFYTWANEICAGDNEERALVISSMNGMQYAVDAWLPLVIFPQTMAPTFSEFSKTFTLSLSTVASIKYQLQLAGARS
ncbi:pantothenate transporter liz1 [Colletotrichum lupini]|uniref:Pantothenate transporter liz1 n=1 Tax=Colletotrichum lupini TaxID=145971 RepID=A0A9Q8SFN8_9PEZI|nr:pantothenate transporter liz1 [Colletotrichum lupini]UQC76439.1 pantothenate transporter liz1 [Colletotrichum lupini]